MGETTQTVTQLRVEAHAAVTELFDQIELLGMKFVEAQAEIERLKTQNAEQCRECSRLRRAMLDAAKNIDALIVTPLVCDFRLPDVSEDLHLAASITNDGGLIAQNAEPSMEAMLEEMRGLGWIGPINISLYVNADDAGRTYARCIVCRDYHTCPGFVEGRAPTHRAAVAACLEKAKEMGK